MILPFLASAQVLKQSTAVTVQIGPAVAASDGNTEVADLTITEIEISKAGGTFAAPNGSATLTLDDDGFYKLALTTSDTDTLGLLVVKVVDATAMTWGERYQVIAANAYDGIYGSGDYLQVDAVQVEGTDATDTLGTAQTGDAYARLGAPAGASISADIAALPTAAENRAEMDSNSTQLAAIVADTNELQTDDYPTTLATLATAAALATVDSNVDAILVDTGTTLPGTLSTISGYIDTEVAAILADTGELQTDWADGGRLDLLLDGASSAGDPWTTALPGAYGAGTAGAIIGALTEPIDANVTQWLGTAAATPNTAGVPIVDVGYVDGNAATDNTAALVDAILDELLSGHSTPGSLAQALTDILADTNELQTDDYPTTLASLAASIATIDAIVDSILIDTGTTLDTAITTIDTNVDSIYTEILKVPRVGQSHTYTNDVSGASEAVTITQP